MRKAILIAVLVLQGRSIDDEKVLRDVDPVASPRSSGFPSRTIDEVSPK
jgi:hypothetical protein